MQADNPILAAIPLPPNPVWRSYSGGHVLRRFRGVSTSADDHFPEDWLASTVCARNGEHGQCADEGLSHIGDGAGLVFAESLAQNPEYWFGRREARRTRMPVLWKLLDSSVRLQVQAHPDARFARKHLGADAGKTECWYILETRGDAFVFLGFQRPPSPKAWARMIREQRVNDLLACFDPLPVQPGDCYVVPAGIPHAIGAGVFMVELMEPTDWVVRCERTNADVTLPPESCFMGLELEQCLGVFDYRAFSVAEVRRAFQQSPRIVQDMGTMVEEEIIGAPWHTFFRLHRLRGAGPARWPGNELMLLIALKGRGELCAGVEAHPVRAGQTWLLPGAVPDWQWRNVTPDWECVLAKLPVMNRTTTARSDLVGTTSK